MIRMRWDYAQLDSCPADVLTEIIRLLNEEATE